MKTRLAKLLDRLEKFHGKPKRPRPEDPYEMVLHRNCGYPQSDDRCDKGFLALKQKVGLRPAEILATPETKLAEVMRAGGMVPELRARRLKEIAARVESEFGGDLQAVLRRPLSEAKKAFKKFPTIGDEDGASRGGSSELRTRLASPGVRRGKEELRRNIPFCAGSAPL
jgi:endonuclease III